MRNKDWTNAEVAEYLERLTTIGLFKDQTSRMAQVVLQEAAGRLRQCEFCGETPHARACPKAVLEDIVDSMNADVEARAAKRRI